MNSGSKEKGNELLFIWNSRRQKRLQIRGFVVKQGPNQRLWDAD